MAPMPASRSKPRTHVFAYAASYLAGPFSVTVGRSLAKRWICLFVCMVTTAIRIKVSVDLTASTFINVFQMFSTGFCTKILRTSNGTNFVGANNLFRREIKATLNAKYASKELQSKMEEWEIQWEFGPPNASHHGGLYERKIQNIQGSARPLIRSVFEDELPPLRPIDLMVGALEPTTECSYPRITEPSDELRREH